MWLDRSGSAYDREGTGLNVPEKAALNLAGMQAAFAQDSVKYREAQRPSRTLL